ncbi:MAG TPA: orotate phosphoribosyltransferase [Gammaproteobacteria bacterium]
MQSYKQAFLEFAIQQEVLKFGEFRLKSGRMSPYFFNAGLFNTGQALGKLGRLYAQAIVEAGMNFDVLYGPAYKGIPLAVATAVALAEQHGKNVPYAFNRKESKNHGEGGNIIGGSLSGRVLIIDDVITAGTAIREAMAVIKASGGQPAGVIISLNREERGNGGRSAIQEIEEEYGVQIASIASFADLLDFMRSREDLQPYAGAMEVYRKQYGV